VDLSVRLSSFPKLCGCGATWSAEAWQGLAYAGVMSDHLESLELRHCTCGSTIAMHVCVVEAWKLGRAGGEY
jgi:hypothetical protein